MAKRKAATAVLPPETSAAPDEASGAARATRPEDLRFELRHPDTLPDNEMNWRKHGEAQLTLLRELLDRAGWAGAALYNERTGRLIDGHARKALALSRGEMVPTLIGSWDEDQEKQLLLELDPIGAMASAHRIKLEALRTVLESKLALLQGTWLGNRGKTNPDAIPEPPDEATTRPGDLWLLGEHRLLCGDSSRAEDVDRLLDGQPIHLVNTDPPYNVRVEPRSNNAIAAGLPLDPARHPGKAKPTGRKLRAKDRPLANDFLSDEAFNELLHAWFGNLSRVLLPGHGFYVWGGYTNLGNYPPVLKACGLYFSQGIVWDKQHPVQTRKDFMGCFELAFYGWKEGAAHRFFGPNNALDLWPVKKVHPQSMIHLTEKPVELAARAMKYSSRAGENVLDLFGGSGSTLIAAEQTGRRAFLMELDPLYADVIVTRYEQFTGKKAERIAAGEPVEAAP